MKLISTLLLLVVTLFFLSPGISSNSDPEPPRFVESEKSLFDISEDQIHTFGYLEVPENRHSSKRQNSKSQTIKLPVYIFKSRSQTPAKDPIIWLTGGPGSSIMYSARYTQYYQYLNDRDLILVEQRGTSYAQPHLDCPEWAKAVHKANYLELTHSNPKETQNERDDLLTDAAATCRNRLSAKGIDLDSYTTREIAADIEDLRRVLGFDSYNLYTLSYGTKIAQVLMRDYPEHIRSVVMDGPLPLEVNYEEESSKNLLQTYDLIFEDCERDPVCNEAYPNLSNRFYSFLEEKTTNPLEIELSPEGKDTAATAYLRGKDIAVLLGNLGTSDMNRVPLLISQLIEGDYTSLSTVLPQSAPGSGAGTGMRLSVWCAEEHPFNSQQTILDETVRYPAIKGLNPTLYSSEVCTTWNVTPEPATENLPIKSDIPTLILNGKYDPITPMNWGKALHQNLSNSYHMIFEGYHHSITTYWDNTCGMQVANAFFNDPTSKPDLACFEELTPFRFEVE